MYFLCFFQQSLVFSKQLMRATEKEKLHAVNIEECERLKERWLSDECMNAIISFFQKRVKLWWFVSPMAYILKFYH